ncbi:MAG: hypothetical protein CM1200mP10_24350 [Candidatus Neomarinimicrobiota bacterium]|nr:MAG: hypothetical protein CM1200mP10_24350 [Candidatus Neomarinimicrobiota bacterium]
MKYRNLGKSGLKVSELSYGSWVTFSFQLDTELATKMLKIAYDSVSISLIMRKPMPMVKQRL